jgi:GT2 family glycosyltransferase
LAPPLWAAFDTAWYQRRYKVAADAETFYHERGAALGHSPNPYFDEHWYLSVYRDAASKVAAGEYPSGFAHYLAEGHQDRSPHWLFSDRFYQAGNADITKSRLEQAGFVNNYAHYLSNGDAEYRAAHLFFSPAAYAASRPGESVVTPFGDFVRDDCKAGSLVRLSAYFDPVWYLQTYPQVAEAIAAGRFTCALEHYLCNDSPRDFDPSPDFSEAFYTSVHVDVIGPIAAGQFRNGFDHFIQFGVFECRKPAPWIDLAAYFRAVDVQADIAGGLCRDVFAHYVGNLKRGDAAEIEIAEPVARALFARRAKSLRPLFSRRPLEFGLTGQPAVSVVMVMYNQFDLTLNALDSVRRNYNGPIELILVDSGSADESRFAERYVTGAKFVRFSHNVGFIEACNAAFAHVTAPAVLLLNNDVLLERGAIEAALARLAGADDIGAVGGKIVRANGVLQEAGCIVWRDGSTQGYLRDADPNVPEANFVRDVDFCSGVFLAGRADLIKRLGGFDPAFKPAYFEETDLCIQLHEAGFRVVYDPAIMVTHQEYSSGDPAIALNMMAQNQPKFKKKNLRFLKAKYPRNAELVTHARALDKGGRKILFIEDRVPLRALGSGFTRSNDIVWAMASLGHQVSVYPVYQPIETVLNIYRDFPEDVEIIHDRELKDLASFIRERSGYFDALWIARTHNAARVLDVLTDVSAHLPINRIVLDTEAVAAARDAKRAVVKGEPAVALKEAVQAELARAGACQKIIAVNETDAGIIRGAGFGDVAVLGHRQMLRPTVTPFEERRGLLFVGAIHEQDSPNLDGLEWFVNEVMPLLDERLDETAELTIAGYVNRRVDLTHLANKRRVRLVGPVDDLAPLYEQHRVFVAPTRFASGIAFKIHEAASYGLPIVASTLLCEQVGWRGDVELLSGDIFAPAQFATQVEKLYSDGALWQALRAAAMARLAQENSPELYRQTLAGILAGLWG